MSKVYSLMIWLTYIMKCLSPKFSEHLSQIDTQLKNRGKIFFLVMRTLRTYSTTSYITYSNVNYVYYVKHYISRTYLS